MSSKDGTKLSIQCSDCGQWREVGYRYALKIKTGERPDLCRQCSTQKGNQERLAAGQIRVKGKNNKWVILQNRTCESCGTVEYVQRRKAMNKVCEKCKNKGRKVENPRIKWPKGVPHPVCVKSPRPKNLFFRCHGVWTECPRYSQCLDVAIRYGWPGWICSEPGQKFHEVVCVPSELKDAIEWYDQQMEYDPLDSHLGIDTSRAPTR